MHNMIIRCLSVEITYVTDCSLGVRLYHDISAVIIGILRRYGCINVFQKTLRAKALFG